jgi:hypothetical protein
MDFNGTICAFFVSLQVASCASGGDGPPRVVEGHAVRVANSPPSLVNGESARDAPLPVVEGDGYRGAIFPPDRAQYGSSKLERWLPSAADVAEFEGRLASALTSALEDPSQLDEVNPSRARAHLNSIVPVLKSYTRQYAGIVVNGRRLLVGGFFMTPEEFPDWRRRWVTVRGGGTDFWHIKFDVAAKRFIELSVNADR